MKAIILDRDGVINEECLPHVCSPQDWVPIPGSLQAIALLNQMGYQVFVATNQSGIGKGLYSLTVLDHIHQGMRQALAQVGGMIADIIFCPHHPEVGCACRKPKPGLLLTLAERHGLVMDQLYFVGDSWTDILAALACGAKPVLVHTGKGKRVSEQYSKIIHDQGISEFENLWSFVLWLKQEEMQ